MDIKLLYNESKELIDSHDLEEYVHLLLNYWVEHPTTLGHGFTHVLEVALHAYQIGILNNYPKPEYLFVGGLFHDVHRPAESGTGIDDQTYGAKVVENLFPSVNAPEELLKIVVSAVKSHDGWIGEDNPPEYDLYLSIGDKQAHNANMVYGYSWANKKYKEQHGEKFQTSYLKLLYLFGDFQRRAWNLFYNYSNVTGIESAVESYLQIYADLTSDYRKDPQSEGIYEHLDEVAKDFTIREEELLALFGYEDSDIRKLLINHYASVPD